MADPQSSQTPSSDERPVNPYKATPSEDSSSVQDIFSEVDSTDPVVTPSVTSPVAQEVASSTPSEPSVGAPMNKKFVLIGVGAVLIVAFLIFAGVLLYNVFSPGTPTSSEVPADDAPTAEEPSFTQPSVTPEPTTPAVDDQGLGDAMQDAQMEVDTDGDGLTDVEEVQLGTSSRLVDTEHDGLSDREEVRVYGTDPLNADTDGDGFLDGEEVQNAYNPNGPGKLYVAPGASQ